MKKSLAASAAALLAMTSIGIEAATPASGGAAPLLITRAGSVPSVPGAVPHNFTGGVRVDMLHAPKPPSRYSAAFVTFEPGARTVWHTHPVGQTLIVTTGVGLVQREGDAVETIRPGDVVQIPAGVRHWHGAAPKTGMTHIAITEAADGRAVDWMEPVTDRQYAPEVSR